MTPSRKARCIHVGTALASATIIAATALLMFWQYRPYSNIHATPFQTDRDTYAPGDIIVMSNHFCWDGTPFTVNRWFIQPTISSSAGSLEYTAISETAQERFNASTDGCVDSTVRIQVPLSQPPGTWQVQYRAAYDPNPSPLRTVTFTVTSNEFIVSPAVPDAPDNVKN